MHSVRAEKRCESPATGREDIEAAVAASGLTVGDRVTMTGSIIYLSADSSGAVWLGVRLDGERGHGVACWATDIESGPHKGKSDE